MIRNARIYTFDAGNTLVESGSMAFSDSGEILAIGDNEPMAETYCRSHADRFAGKDRVAGLD